MRETAQQVSETVPFALVAYDFVERYVTELQQLSPEERRSRMMRDDVELVQGDFSRVALVDEQTVLEFSENKNRYRVALLNGANPVIDLSFPASCQLLTGKKLTELEHDFMEGLAAHAGKGALRATELRKSDCESVAGGLLWQPGDSYYLKEINTGLYLEERGGKCLPVFSAKHPVESTINLLQAVVGEEVQLDLTVRKYGLKKEQTHCRFCDWADYVRSEGGMLYVGIESVDETSVQGTVFVVHHALKYNHVMNVTVPLSLLSEGKGAVKGDINLFIPMHNVASLFGELEK